MLDARYWISFDPAGLNQPAYGRRYAGAIRQFCRIVPLVLAMQAITLQGCRPEELVRPTPQMGVEARYWVRVLLLDDVSNCVVKAFTPLQVSAGQADGPAQPVVLYYPPRRQVSAKIEVAGGQFIISGRPVAGSEITISSDKPYVFNLQGDNYRGRLKLVLGADGQSFDAINLVPLEAYLAGVIGAEMPDYWEPEALKAQAIAARTYCLYMKNRSGRGRSWDVSKTQASQVYCGVAAESSQIWKAVYDTYGKVLICEKPNTDIVTSVPNRIDQLFPAYYSSTCGGHTENSKNVFGDSFEPLAGVACPYCKDVAKLGLFYWPMVQFETSDVTSKLSQKYPKLKELGDITNIEHAEKSDYESFSRLTKVRVTGATGKSETIRAEDLRLCIDPTGRKIRSTACYVVKLNDKWTFLSGRGWGHAVGLCQCGAEGMARQGKTAGQILSYYYPGSEIVIIY